MRAVLLLVVLSSIAKSQRVSLIGSHFIPIDSNYTAFLSTHKLEPGSNINVTISNKDYSRSVYLDSFDDNSFNPVELELPNKRSADYTLRILANIDNQCVYQTTRLKNLQESPLTFIYLDKPIYKPSDKVIARIFLLGQDMLPYPDYPLLNVKFYDSNGASIKNFEDLRTTIFGFSEVTLTIPSTQNFGDWKIEVQAKSRKKSKNFKVQPENEANFDAFLDMPDTIAHDDREFKMTILTRAENDNVFEGTAKIEVKGRTRASNKDEINKVVKLVNLLGNKNDISLKFREDLGIVTPSDEMNLTFEVDVLDNTSQQTIKVKKEVRMLHKGRNVIQVVRKKYFKPGFKFPIKVRVKTMTGQPDNSFNKLIMTIEYKTRDGVTKEKKALEVNLKNGETSTNLTPAMDTDKIRILLEMGGTSMIENIQKLTTYGIDEYLQASFVNKSSKIGDKVQLQVQSTGEMETLNLLVFGANGLVYSEEFPDAVGKDIYNFDIHLTEVMRPEIRGLVFYIRPNDGLMVYDEFMLSLGFSIHNFLEISAPAQVKPNEKVEVTIKSQPGSFILLTGIDQRAELYNFENEISRIDAYNELTYYINFSVPNVHEYKYEKVNNFVLEPIQKGARCGHKQPSIPSSSESSDVKAWTQKYFPNIWFDKVFVMDSETKILNLKVPNEVKNWRVYGISVHQSKGLTIAKKLPEIVVRGDFSINIKAPSIVKEDEVFEVDVSAYSFVAGYIQPTIQIEVISGFLMNSYTQEHSGRTCFLFKLDSKSSFVIFKQLNPEQRTSMTSLYVKSKWNDELQIRATSWFGGAAYESVKKVKVKRIERESPNSFNINAEVRTVSNEEADVIINTKMESHAESGSNLVMEVGLPSGYKYVNHEIADHIKEVQYDANNNTVKFHLNHLERLRSYKNLIRIEKVFDVYEKQRSMIKIYGTGQSSIFSYAYDINLSTCQVIAEAMKCKLITFWNCF